MIRHQPIFHNTILFLLKLPSAISSSEGIASDRMVCISDEITSSVLASKTQQLARRLKKTMTINFVSLIFIWLLSLTTSSAVTPGQNHNSTNVMTGEVRNQFTHDQLTTQEASNLSPFTSITRSIMVDVNPTEGKTTKPSTKPSLQTTQSTPSKTFLPSTQTAATPTNPISSQLKSSTVAMKSTAEVQFKVTTSTTTGATSQASNSTTTTRIAVMLSSSTISQDTGKTSTSHLISDKITHPSTRPKQSTNVISTTTKTTTKKQSFHITEKKKRQDDKSKKETSHSKAVAGLIGGALVLMMVGFLVIYIKKRKLQKQQITTRDWAGPSPFLEGGADNGQVTLRSSNRISLSSFLPQRLSKRLSLLPETDEELEDMTPGTTFGDKHQGGTFGRGVDGNDVQESNGTSVVVPEKKSTEGVPETVENSVSVSSSQMNDPLSTNNNSEIANLGQDHPATPPTLSGAEENALAQVNDGHGQP